MTSDWLCYIVPHSKSWTKTGLIDKSFEAVFTETSWVTIDKDLGEN